MHIYKSTTIYNIYITHTYIYIHLYVHIFSIFYLLQDNVYKWAVIWLSSAYKLGRLNTSPEDTVCLDQSMGSYIVKFINTLLDSNMAMDNPIYIVFLLIKSLLFWGFPIAMFDHHRVIADSFHLFDEAKRICGFCIPHLEYLHFQLKQK